MSFRKTDSGVFEHGSKRFYVSDWKVEESKFGVRKCSLNMSLHAENSKLEEIEFYMWIRRSCETIFELFLDAVLKMPQSGHAPASLDCCA